MWLLGTEYFLRPLLTLIDPALSAPLTVDQRFIYCHTEVYCSCLQMYQKRASGLIMGGCKPPCVCWELNSGPSEEQSVLLPTEPSHQPHEEYFLCSVFPHASTQQTRQALLKCTGDSISPVSPVAWSLCPSYLSNMMQSSLSRQISPLGTWWYLLIL